MSEGTAHPVWNLMGLLFKAHPWHGVAIGPEAPRRLTAYIEIVPADTVKFEIDKVNGYLRIDRPQQFSNICPSLYGLIPQTLCVERVAALCMEKTGREGIVGDGDPLDICVLTEKSLSHGDVLVEAIPIGGLRLIDGDEADDKIVAVLKGDAVYGGVDDIANCPQSVLERLKHYFLTYKQDPESPQRKVEIDGVYGATEAHEVIVRSQQDYQARFAGIYSLLKG
jgi:inorganic pyrophosphatase